MNRKKSYDGYKKYCKELKDSTLLNFREIDKGLWAFGKHLKNENHRKIIEDTFEIV